MIVASLLLIVVAVTLLVVGLAAGSSTLLIASIVASLFAAIALVIGARQATGRAASAGPTRTPLAVDLDDDPGPAFGLGEAGRFAPVDPVEPYAAAPSGSTVDARSASTDETVVGLGTDPMRPDAGSAHAGRPDAPSSDAGGSDPGEPDGRRPGTVPHEAADTEVLSRTSDGEDAEGRAAGDPYADFHREQAAAAHHHEHAGADGGWPMESGVDDSAGPDVADTVHAAHEAGARDVDAYGATGLRSRGEQPSGDPDASDDEDPADEPAPQRTQPADAVRVSRMIAEVLVVDGRPRYHLGDCPSLSGRISEALPVAEAVELGFTPCSMCRPVDRLAAEAVPR